MRMTYYRMRALTRAIELSDAAIERIASAIETMPEEDRSPEMKRELAKLRNEQALAVQALAVVRERFPQQAEQVSACHQPQPKVSGAEMLYGPGPHTMGYQPSELANEVAS